MTQPEERPATAPGTGNAEVDAVLAGLRGADELPLEERLAAYTAAHDRLTQLLAGEPRAE